MRWAAGGIAFAAYAAVLVFVPAIASGHACTGGWDDPLGACGHIVAIAVFIAIAAAGYIPLLIYALRR